MISTFHKDHSKKLIGILAFLNFTLLIAKPTVKLPRKRKQKRLAKGITKHIN